MSCHGSGRCELVEGEVARDLSPLTRVPPASKLTIMSGSTTAPTAMVAVAEEACVNNRE